MFRRLILPVGIALSLVVAGCGSTATPTAPTPELIAITDSTGHEVTLAAPAQHIVSLAPSNTEIVFAIGAGDRLVARDDFSDYPPEAANVPSIGSLYPTVNAEAVVALKPDLVLAAGITSREDVEKLVDLGLTVYTTSIAENLDDIYNDILAVGKLTGSSTEAEELVNDLKARVDAVTATTGTASTRPIVFYEVDATEPSKPWTAGTGTFIDVLITLAGGTNAGSVGADYFQISLEQLVTQDPEVIILGSSLYGGQTPELVAQRAGWDDIRAVKGNAVYTFDDNLVSRPGPRVVDGLEALAKLIHPELFQ